LLGSLIVSTLINNNFFETIVSSAYYYYLIISSLVIGLTGVIYLKHKGQLYVNIPIPILLFASLPVYYLLQNLYYNHSINVPVYYIINAFLLFAYYVVFSIYTITFSSVYKLITFIASFEAFYCLLQFCGVIGSDTSSFSITGTWDKPKCHCNVYNNGMAGCCLLVNTIQKKTEMVINNYLIAIPDCPRPIKMQNSIYWHYCVQFNSTKLSIRSSKVVTV
jgi:hypothetical protein